MLNIRPIPAFTDNYIWCLDDGRHAYLVDPGDAEPALAFLERHRLTLAGLLITHHHLDHIGGIAGLRQHFPDITVYGPRNPAIAGIDHALGEGDTLAVLGSHWRVLAVPGHTLDHIAYFCADHQPPLLLCGDTLFAAGCGRLFEGSAAQMYASLQRLAQLPDITELYCAHEYTLSNLRFARAAEPDNRAVQRRFEAVSRMRDRAEITLPSSIGLERQTNPFLRCDTPELQRAARGHDAADTSPEQVFAALRRWKDHF